MAYRLAAKRPQLMEDFDEPELAQLGATYAPPLAAWPSRRATVPAPPAPAPWQQRRQQQPPRRPVPDVMEILGGLGDGLTASDCEDEAVHHGSEADDEEGAASGELGEGEDDEEAGRKGSQRSGSGAGSDREAGSGACSGSEEEDGGALEDVDLDEMVEADFGLDR
jgi:hypothetical protein